MFTLSSVNKRDSILPKNLQGGKERQPVSVVTVKGLFIITAHLIGRVTQCPFPCHSQGTSDLFNIPDITGAFSSFFMPFECEMAQYKATSQIQPIWHKTVESLYHNRFIGNWFNIYIQWGYVKSHIHINWIKDILKYHHWYVTLKQRSGTYGSRATPGSLTKIMWLARSLTLYQQLSNNAM